MFHLKNFNDLIKTTLKDQLYLARKVCKDLNAKKKNIEKDFKEHKFSADFELKQIKLKDGSRSTA